MQKIRTRRVGGALRLSETCARTCSASLWKSPRLTRAAKKRRTQNEKMMVREAPSRARCTALHAQPPRVRAAACCSEIITSLRTSCSSNNKLVSKWNSFRNQVHDSFGTKINFAGLLCLCNVTVF